MIGLLKPYIESKTDDLDYHERAILSIAFKNAVGMRRIAWRAINKAQNVAKYEVFEDNILAYQNKLEEECVDLCKEMLSLITAHLLPKARKAINSVESEVYYLKLQADYYRYVAEVGSTEDRVEKAKNRALTAYNNAIKIAD